MEGCFLMMIVGNSVVIGVKGRKYQSQGETS
jgi:hypothetical protein